MNVLKESNRGYFRINFFKKVLFLPFSLSFSTSKVPSMFNIYTFEKKVSQDEELKKMKDQFIKEEERRKGQLSHSFLLSHLLIIVKQTKLVNNYNKRIENFVLHVRKSSYSSLPNWATLDG